MLGHRIAVHNFEHYQQALETAIVALKRAAWRMAQRRSYESLARWAEGAAGSGATVTLEQLRAELARRSAKLDSTETEDEQRDRAELDREIAANERRARI